jgi:hypothetical protein
MMRRFHYCERGQSRRLIKVHLHSTKLDSCRNYGRRTSVTSIVDSTRNQGKLQQGAKQRIGVGLKLAVLNRICILKQGTFYRKRRTIHFYFNTASLLSTNVGYIGVGCNFFNKIRLKVFELEIFDSDIILIYYAWISLSKRLN